jgi:hypothetical protein
MNNSILEKYYLQYGELNQQFLSEVERGTEWKELKSLMNEIKKVQIFIADIEESQPSNPREEEASPVPPYSREFR